MPVYNEAEIIEGVVRSYYEKIIRKFPGSEFIICEDGSTDGTRGILARIAKEIPVRLSTGKEKKGYLRASRDALGLARGEWVFFSDSDGQHDPADFWKLYEQREGFDLVVGSRAERNDPLFRKVLSRGFNLIVSLMFGVRIRDFNAGFKLMKGEVAEKVVPKIRHVKYGFSTELIVRAHNAGYKVREVPVKHMERKSGEAAQFKPGRIPRVIYEQMMGLLALRLEKG